MMSKLQGSIQQSHIMNSPIQTAIYDLLRGHKAHFSFGIKITSTFYDAITYISRFLYFNTSQHTALASTADRGKVWSSKQFCTQDRTLSSQFFLSTSRNSISHAYISFIGWKDNTHELSKLSIIQIISFVSFQHFSSSYYRTNRVINSDIMTISFCEIRETVYHILVFGIS